MNEVVPRRCHCHRRRVIQSVCVATTTILTTLLQLLDHVCSKPCKLNLFPTLPAGSPVECPSRIRGLETGTLSGRHSLPFVVVSLGDQRLLIVLFAAELFFVQLDYRFCHEEVVFLLFGLVPNTELGILSVAE